MWQWTFHLIVIALSPLIFYWLSGFKARSLIRPIYAEMLKGSQSHQHVRRNNKQQCTSIRFSISIIVVIAINCVHIVAVSIIIVIVIAIAIIASVIMIVIVIHFECGCGCGGGGWEHPILGVFIVPSQTSFPRSTYLLFVARRRESSCRDNLFDQWLHSGPGCRFATNLFWVFLGTSIN